MKKDEKRKIEDLAKDYAGQCDFRYRRYALNGFLAGFRAAREFDSKPENWPDWKKNALRGQIGEKIK